MLDFQNYFPEPFPLPSNAANGQHAVKRILPVDDDNVAGALINISMRYIDACAFIGLMAGLMTNEVDRNEAKKIIEVCAKSFQGAIEFVEVDGGGWISKWCNTKEPK